MAFNETSRAGGANPICWMVFGAVCGGTPKHFGMASTSLTATGESSSGLHRLPGSDRDSSSMLRGSSAVTYRTDNLFFFALGNISDISLSMPGLC